MRRSLRFGSSETFRTSGKNQMHLYRVQCTRALKISRVQDAARVQSRL